MTIDRSKATIRPRATDPSASKLEYAASIMLGEVKRPWHSHPEDADRLMLVADWLMLMAERARRGQELQNVKE